MAERIPTAERRAYEVLATYAVDDFPIPLDDLAQQLDAVVVYQPMESDVSGMLHRMDDRAVIGVNSFHPATRQRFTIAHELGHLCLHVTKDLFVDLGVRKRDGKSGLGTDREEVEANRFAAGLLMPRDRVRDEVVRRVSSTKNVSVDSLVMELAELFGVSTQAMEIRLTDLGILSFR